ncbi:hypothetical protein [Legionella drozanskii]|nr:hypothetical protein [Legionella drozanskii]
MINKKRLINFISLLLLALYGDSYAICPQINFQARCINNSWQVLLDTSDKKYCSGLRYRQWTLMSEDVNGKPCQLGEQAKITSWNYATESSFFNVVTCNYTLLNDSFVKIGDFQIKNHDVTHYDKNWETGEQPGDWVCRLDQKECNFRAKYPK